MARVYGEFYHAGGVAKELRNIMLGSRTAADAIAGMEWLYGEQAELVGGGAARCREEIDGQLTWLTYELPHLFKERHRLYADDGKNGQRILSRRRASGRCAC